MDPVPPANHNIRLKLLNIASEKGSEYLYSYLKEVDPIASSKVSSNDLKRIIRYLEVYLTTGRPISSFWSWNKNSYSKYQFIKIGLKAPRNELYDRINARCDKMINQGLLDEVRSLIKRGLNPKDHTSMQAIGYRHAYQYLTNQINYQTFIHTFKRDTRHYAKRQISLFKQIGADKWINYNNWQDALTFLKIKLEDP